MWNMDESESTSLLAFLKPYELKKISEQVAIQETEALTYCYNDNKLIFSFLLCG
jgi:hypothetical protein